MLIYSFFPREIKSFICSLINNCKLYACNMLMMIQTNQAGLNMLCSLNSGYTWDVTFYNFRKSELSVCVAVHHALISLQL